VTVIGGETGRRARWIYLLACIATTVIYPLTGLKLIRDYHNLGAIILLNYRNALLIGLLLLLLFGKEAAAEPLAGEHAGPATHGGGTIRHDESS
jgi:hypothetical protein